MARLANWEDQIGRGLRLRDLHVFHAVAERGSMVRAAAELGISQPAVSDVIANLELSLGARLFDRHPHGVEPTVFGQVLLKRSVAALDELKQGVRDIEFLSDPSSGALRIGCGATVSAAILPPIVRQFSREYPRVALNVNEVQPPTRDLSGLRDRTHDLIMGRWRATGSDGRLDDDINVDVLFDDPLVVAVGSKSRLARRRIIDLAELADETWILPGPNTWNYMGMLEAFRSQGLDLPKIGLTISSIHVSTHLLANGDFVTAISRSLARRYGLEILPVELPVRPWPVAIMTLKNRTLSPVVERFIDCARSVIKSMDFGPAARRRQRVRKVK